MAQMVAHLIGSEEVTSSILVASFVTRYGREKKRGCLRETAGGSFFLTSITDEFLGQTLNLLCRELLEDEDIELRAERAFCK